MAWPYRDGSAVELVGLSKSVVTWLADLADKKHYTYTGVYKNVNGTNLLQGPEHFVNIVIQNTIINQNVFFALQDRK